MNLMTLVYMVGITLIGAFGSFFLKRGSDKLQNTLVSFFFNSNLLVGIGFYVISTALYIVLLKKVDLSLLYPLTSLSYVWVIILAKIMLKEHISKSKIFGTALIVCGIIILAN
jgi:drug/metabolite transporter (DMT)-like permease